MNVLVVTKTRMNPGYCVGGLALDNNRNVRLLPPNGHNQPTNTRFSVGQIWDLILDDVANAVAPHTEDVRVLKSKPIKTQSQLAAFLSERVPIVLSHPQQLFDGLLGFTRGNRAYISQRTGVPNYSTVFSRLDYPMVKLEGQKPFYQFQYSSGTFEIPYVGIETPIDIIPQNTLVRFSLARWWKPEGVDMELRCYLQLSGWYIG